MLLLDAAAHPTNTKSRCLLREEAVDLVKGLPQHRITLLFKYGKPVDTGKIPHLLDKKILDPVSEKEMTPGQVFAFRLMKKYPTIYAVDEKHEKTGIRGPLDTMNYTEIISLLARMDIEDKTGKQPEVKARAQKALDAGKTPLTTAQYKARREEQQRQFTERLNTLRDKSNTILDEIFKDTAAKPAGLETAALEKCPFEKPDDREVFTTLLKERLEKAHQIPQKESKK